MIYWHGTTEAKLESILANGLDPACTKFFDHVCLASNPEIATLFGAIAFLGAKSPKTIILIAVQDDALDEGEFCVEAGAIKSKAMGHEAHPHRSPRSLEKLMHDEPGFFQATETRGYRKKIPVSPDMVHRLTLPSNVLTTSALLDVYGKGSVDPVTARRVKAVVSTAEEVFAGRRLAEGSFPERQVAA